MANRYWFARRFPLSVGGDRMSPVTREGWIVVWAFVAAMGLGAVALFVATLVFQKPLIGFIIFLVLASFGMTGFLLLAKQRGDNQHTVEDYKAGRVGKTS